MVNLNSPAKTVDTSSDEIIIRKVLVDIPGGRALDVSGYTPTGTGVSTTVLSAGHPIIEETSSGNLKPLDVDNGAFVALPNGHTYKGVLISSVLKDQPIAAVGLSVDMNDEAFKNATGLTFPSAAKTALTHCLFNKD